jgi:hypothetical protein
MSIDTIVVSVPTENLPKDVRLYEPAVFVYQPPYKSIAVKGDHFKLDAPIKACRIDDPTCESCQ